MPGIVLLVACVKIVLVIVYNALMDMADLTSNMGLMQTS
jgi:hypothetical protein